MDYYSIVAMEPHTDNVRYRFVHRIALEFGQALYLAGSTTALGNWNVTKAIRMLCLDTQHWAAEVQVELNHTLEYKYFVWRYDEPPSVNCPKLRWLGHQNSQLYIPSSIASAFHATLPLTVMSFNIRYLTNRDTGPLHWQSRKQNCVDLIMDIFPDLVCTQEVVWQQSQYLQNKLRPFYAYFGRPRDSQRDEEVGIFVRKDRFLVIEEDTVWLSESRLEGSVGFDAKLPRSMHYLVLRPILDELHCAEQPIIVANTHLDHVGYVSRQQAIGIISQVISLKKIQRNASDCIVTGDFNVPQNSPIFHELQVEGRDMVSLRCLLPQEAVNASLTFNGFQKDIHERALFNGPEFVKQRTIDHMFVYLKHYQATRFTVVKTQGKIVSDHYPILGSFLPCE